MRSHRASCRKEIKYSVWFCPKPAFRT